MQARATITEHEQQRRRRGIGITRLSLILGVSHSYASRIEGQSIPASARYRRAVSRLLDVPESDLFDQEGRAKLLSPYTEEVTPNDNSPTRGRSRQSRTTSK